MEGGGMRGIISAAMLSALEDLGLASAFDAVYGASSGAVNCAYFLAGESWYPLSVYYDDLTTSEFLDFRRALWGDAILNVDYAFDVVFEHVKILDYAAVLSSQIPLHVSLTMVDEIEAAAPAQFESKNDLKAALRASGWLPIATKGTATFRGRRAIDGGVLVPHPFKLALLDGCTHILSLSTRPVGPPHDHPSLLQRFAAWRLEHINRGLGSAFLTAVRGYARERAYLEASRTVPTRPYILDLAPPTGTPEIKRHEMDPGILLNGARTAYELTVLAIEGRTGRAIPRLTIRDL